MKRVKLLIVILICLTIPGLGQSPFTSGNVVVYRVGAVGNPGLVASTATQVYLDEYSPAGTLVQSILMPTALGGGGNPSNKILTATGTRNDEGMISLSADNRFLVLTGYNAAVGTGGVNTSPSTTINRVVGLVDANATINTTTALTDYASLGFAKSAASTNGTDIWCTSNGSAAFVGIRYTTLGSNTSVRVNPLTTNRCLSVVSNQLYSSTTTFLGSVNGGLPTSGDNAVTALPGLPTGSPFQYVLIDMDAGTPGVDVLYIADDNATAGGIKKFSLVAGSWVSNGVIGNPADAYRGLTAIITATTNVQLFAVTKGGNTSAGGGELVTITDNTGYNATITGTPSLLATATANTAFRGICLVPVSSCTAASINTNPAPQNICSNNMATLSVVAAGTAPFNYQWYQGNTGDESIPVGTNSNSFTTPALTVSTNYWVKVGNGCSGSTANSSTATVSIYSAATWTGAVNNDFNTAGNWNTNCVPATGMSITIPSGTVVLTGGSVSIQHLTIQAGAILSLDNGAVMNIKGDCINDGSIVSAGTPSSGKLVFNGTSAQNLSGTGNFSNLEIDNTIGVIVITDISVYNLTVLPNSIFTIDLARKLTILQ